jgi:hypothetical protein
MNEWKPAEKGDLDERLSAYYGSALPEEELPPSAWRELNARLRHGRTPHRRWRWRRNRAARTTPPPSFLIDACERVTQATRQQFSSSLLAYAEKRWIHQPRVSIRPLARQKLRLALPAGRANGLAPAELDVLLATGLARYLYTRKPVYACQRLLGYSALALACLTSLLVALHHAPRAGILIVIALGLALCFALLWFLHWQRRHMALRADGLLVEWLGRGHVCQGLHALASRSRRPSRWRWGELSLAERITHVCGSDVPLQSERLTLAR